VGTGEQTVREMYLLVMVFGNLKILENMDTYRFKQN
jgi:hypothetical protein